MTENEFDELRPGGLASSALASTAATPEPGAAKSSPAPGSAGRSQRRSDRRNGDHVRSAWHAGPREFRPLLPAEAVPPLMVLRIPPLGSPQSPGAGSPRASDRTALHMTVMGWCSATGCIQPGRVSTRTYALVGKPLPTS